jgi:F-type H+-transporting ATPase subunit b
LYSKKGKIIMILSRLIISAVSICGFLFATEGPGHNDLANEGGWMEKWLSFDPGLFIWTIVTFFIVLAILKWKAWGPLIDALDKREEDIRNALSSAEKAKEEAGKVAEDYEEMIRKAQAEAQKIVAESKAAGERVREEIKVTAEKEAGDILEKAQHQIQTEKEKAVQEIRSSVVEFSLQAASKVLERNLDSEDNRRLIKETVDGIGKA